MRVKGGLSWEVEDGFVLFGDICSFLILLYEDVPDFVNCFEVIPKIKGVGCS